MIRIDTERCTQCDLCSQVCPVGIVQPGPEIDERLHGHCLQCGHCYAVCPPGAITVLDLEGPAGDDRRPARVEPDAMMSLLMMRRSVREFRDEPVSEEHLRAILDAASCAPSAKNARPVEATVYRGADCLQRIYDATISHYKGLLAQSERFYFPWMWRLSGRSTEGLPRLRAGVQFLVTPREGEDRLLYHCRTLLGFTAPARDPMGQGDAWLASHNATLYAETLGVGSCHNGYITYAAHSSKSVAEALELPGGRAMVALLMLGYPRLRYMRPAPRKAMPTQWK